MTCSQCKEDKLPSEFHRDKTKASGYVSSCKECKLTLSQNYYQRNRVKVLARVKEWRAANPEKVRAYSRTQKAKASGRLKQEPCLFCGDPNSEAHHPDYNDPLNVIWVCRTHHHYIFTR